jgi:hypothetical protein
MGSGDVSEMRYNKARGTMRKTWAIAGALAFCLAGCAVKEPAETIETASPSPSASALAESTEAAYVPDQLEIIDAVVEEDLPRTLRVTIQDMEVIFTKADAYTCADELSPGDSVKVYYDGDLENHPAVYEAEKE